MALIKMMEINTKLQRTNLNWLGLTSIRFKMIFISLPLNPVSEHLCIYSWDDIFVSTNNMHMPWHTWHLGVSRNFSRAYSISFPELRFPWPAVGKRELWEQPLWKNKGNNRILVIRLTAHLHLWRMPEMVAPRALVFRPLVKGNEALGTRLALTLQVGYACVTVCFSFKLFCFGSRTDLVLAGHSCFVWFIVLVLLSYTQSYHPVRSL